MLFSYFIVIFTLLLNSSQTAKLPSYIEPCSRSDPQLSECAITHGNKVIPIIAKGDKRLKIPNFIPLKLDEVAVEPGNNLRLQLKHVVVWNLENARLINVMTNLDKKEFSFELNLPDFHIISDYKIDGRILVLPIVGEGKANLTFVNTNITLNIKYDFEKINGAEHAKIVKSAVSHSPARVYFKLDNLFNGDKYLGEEMNRFLNENWKDIDQELANGINEAINVFAADVMSKLFKTVTYDEFILP